MMLQCIQYGTWRGEIAHAQLYGGFQPKDYFPEAFSAASS